MLAGQKVVVVGGASGIGRAVAADVLKAGASVVIVGRTPDRLAETVRALGPNAASTVADARDLPALRAAFASLGGFDHLVTTTSVSASSLGVQAALGDMPGEGARAFFEGKFWAQYQAAQAALPHLAAGGSIVFTSGVASRKALPNHSIVAANNAAIEAAARQLARELAPRRVNVVSPGLTDTRAYDHLPAEAKREFFAHVTRGLPVPRVARADEVAPAYLFAMTSSYLTGAVIDIDGGLLVQ